MKKKSEKKPITTKILPVLLSIFISLILFLSLRIYLLEKYSSKNLIKLPPNGTILFQPSPTASPIPRILKSGLYLNKDLKISLTIPESVEVLETTEPDGYIKLKFSNKSDNNLVMIIMKRKRIYGIGGNTEIDCVPLININHNLVISKQEIKRCKTVIQNKISYDIKIDYPDINKNMSLGIFYEFKNNPDQEEFKIFDQIISTIQFI
jgi:hypothetical protein